MAHSKQKRKNANWSNEEKKRLEEIFPTAPWEILKKQFPNRGRISIREQAQRLGLSRMCRVFSQPLFKPSPAPPQPVSNEEIAEFMTRGRSLSEVAEKFKLPPEKVTAKLQNGLDDYDLFIGPKNLNNEQTFVAVPKVGNVKIPERAWIWRQETKENQPYGVINFPDDYIHTKIRIVPIDRVLFGDPAHDSKRFEDTLRYIARTPNTYCFLNGDVIAPIQGGRTKRDQEASQQASIERSVKFEKKMVSVAHKILWAQQGCLEARSLSRQGFDPLQHFCKKHNIPYFDEPIYIDIFWRGHLFTFWTMHGYSTAQLKGTKINALRRPAQVHDFTNFLIMGHIGDAMWNRQIKVCRAPAGETLKPAEEFHIILAGFTKYFGTRAARRGEAPPSRDIIVLYLYPDGNYHAKTRTGGNS